MTILLGYFELFYDCIVNIGYNFHRAPSPTQKNNEKAEIDWTPRM